MPFRPTAKTVSRLRITQVRSVERRFDVGLDLIAVGECIGHVEETDDGHDLAEGFLIDALFAQGRRVGVDAVGAAVGGGNGQSDDLAGCGIEPRRETRCLGMALACLQAGPNDLELDRVDREGAPDRGHEVDFLGLPDVGKNRGDGAFGLVLIDRSNRRTQALQAWSPAFGLNCAGGNRCQRREYLRRVLDLELNRRRFFRAAA